MLNIDVLCIIVSYLGLDDINNFRLSSKDNGKVYETWLRSFYLSVRRDIKDHELDTLLTDMKVYKLDLSECYNLTNVNSLAGLTNLTILNLNKCTG